MSLQTYWLVIAPALLLGLSGFGWLALWLTRRQPNSASAQRAPAPH
jgi:hypothetical protein